MFLSSQRRKCESGERKKDLVLPVFFVHSAFYPKELVMATKVRDYPKLARDIIDAVGGTANIVSAGHCATRLRLVLKEQVSGAKEKVEQMPGVISVVLAGGQFQVVIGMHVKDVYAGVQEVVGDTGSNVELGEDKPSIINRMIGTMAGCMAPCVYILAGAGMLQGLLIILRTIFPALADNGTVQIFDLMSWAPFTFLPVFVAVAGAKYFKCDLQTALVCSFVLVSPTLAGIISKVSGGEEFRLFGFKLASTSYYSTVLPPIFMVWLISKIEKFVKAHCPEALLQLLPPLVCYIIVIPIVLLIIGPISEIIANAIASGYAFLDKTVPPLTALLIGFFWQCFVVFGVHWATTPVVLGDYALNGFNSLQLYAGFAVVAQVGAVFGCALKTRDKNIRGTAISAGITGIFGITEPTIYGVTLRYKKPFFAACAVGAIASLVSCLFFGSKYFAYAGLCGILSIPNSMNPNGDMSSIIGCIVGTIIALVGGFIAVQFTGVESKAKN